MRKRAAAVALLAASALAACGASSATTVLASPSFALPSRAGGCGGAVALPGGATRVPLTVSRSGGRAPQVAVFANVCVDGRGPFPFLVDTGATVTVVDSRFAARLGLRLVGPKQQASGAGCTVTYRMTELRAWSVGGAPLGGQGVAAGSLPGLGGPNEPDGLLGSDVLSRFGAVRIDFGAQALTLPGPEGPLPAAPSVVHGPTSAATPPVLVSGAEEGVAPLTVVKAPGGALAVGSVRFGSQPPLEFAVDTGSTQSAIETSTARQLGLARTGFAETGTTVCSVVTVPVVRSGPWSFGGNPLSLGLIGSTALGLPGISGLLGSEQLSRFGWVVLDYDGGRLVLGHP